MFTGEHSATFKCQHWIGNSLFSAKQMVGTANFHVVDRTDHLLSVQACMDISQVGSVVWDYNAST